jgi:hypothetical protein
MAENDQSTTTSKAKPGEERFDEDYLVEHRVRLFGRSESFVRGAFARSTNKTHTLDQAKDLIKKHGSRKVEFASTEDEEE